jgi:predicted nucleotidyltransferase
MLSSNLKLLESAAAKLKELTEDVVFVGGSTLDLMATEQAAGPTRGTMDVDVIAEITTYKDYVSFSERLLKHGFSADSREGAPLCRWVHGDLALDVMPLNETVLGFSNIWYPGALKTARPATLPSGAVIRLITAPFFLGTKLEAFRTRGHKDFFGSHDLEDFISVVEGRETLLEEISAAPHELVSYLSEAARELLMTPRFLDALPGYFLGDEASQQRVPVVISRLQKMMGT